MYSALVSNTLYTAFVFLCVCVFFFFVLKKSLCEIDHVKSVRSLLI